MQQRALGKTHEAFDAEGYLRGSSAREAYLEQGLEHLEQAAPP